MITTSSKGAPNWALTPLERLSASFGASVVGSRRRKRHERAIAVQPRSRVALGPLGGGLGRRRPARRRRIHRRRRGARGAGRRAVPSAVGRRRRRDRSVPAARPSAPPRGCRWMGAGDRCRARRRDRAGRGHRTREQRTGDRHARGSRVGGGCRSHRRDAAVARAARRACRGRGGGCRRASAVGRWPRRLPSPRTTTSTGSGSRLSRWSPPPSPEWRWPRYSAPVLGRDP